MQDQWKQACADHFLFEEMKERDFAAENAALADLVQQAEDMIMVNKVCNVINMWPTCAFEESVTECCKRDLIHHHNFLCVPLPAAEEM